MGRPWTIRARLIKSLILLLSVFWLAGVVAAALVVHHEIDEMFDSALREATGQIIPIALQDYARLDATQPKPAVSTVHSSSLSARRGHVHFILIDSSGARLLASDGAPRDIKPLSGKNGFFNHNGFRYYARQLKKEGLWIVVAQDARERQEAATGLWLGLASPLLALLPVAAFAVWRTVVRAAQPISQVARELESRNGDNLAAIDASGLPAELTPVIEAVNTLMARLKAALQTERAFAANAAHELRNPIASARAQIQLLAGSLQNTAAHARAENVASQLGQLGRRVERLLQMSRADAGIGYSREHTDLVTIASLIVDDYRHRPDVGPRMRLTTIKDESCWVAMDQDALAIVLRNAIENAVVHGKPGEPIDVYVGPASVRVVNAGPVVPREVLAELKSRFHRGDGLDRGTGLGLAIVDTIMSQSGGSIALRSPATGRDDGFEISLHFRAAV